MTLDESELVDLDKSVGTEQATINALYEEYAEDGYYNEKSKVLESEALQFLFENTPGLDNKVNDFQTLFEAARRESCLADYIAEQAKPGVRLPEKYIMIVINRRQPLTLIKLFKPFITTSDILSFIYCSGENTYWAYGYVRDCIAEGLLEDKQVLSLWYIFAFGEGANSKHAYLNLFRKIQKDACFDDHVYQALKERMQQSIVGYQALQFFDGELIESLPEEKRRFLFDKFSFAELKGRDWIQLDQGLKCYGYRMYNLRQFQSEEAISYLTEQLTNSSDAQWVTNLTFSMGDCYNRSHIEVISEAILRNIEAIDFSSFTSDKHCRLIENPNLIEAIWRRCNRSAQERLADNFGRFYLKEMSYGQVNWEFVSANIDLMLQNWTASCLIAVSLERLKWLWKKTASDTSKCCILRALSYRIGDALNSQENLNGLEDPKELRELYLAWLNTNRNAFDHGKAIGIDFDYENQSGVDCVVYLWQHLGSTVRDLCAERINTSQDYIDLNRENGIKLLKNACIHNLGNVLFSDDTRWEFLSFLSDDAMPNFALILDKVEKSAAAVRYLAKGLSNVSCHLIEAQQYYSHKKKTIREAAQWSLVLSSCEQASNMMSKLLVDKNAKLSDVHVSHFLDALEKNGAVITTSDFTNENLTTYCESKITKVNIKKIARIWSSDLETVWGDNSNLLKYALIVLAQNEWGGIPRLTRQCFETLSEQKRKQVTTKVIESWAQGEANKADFWVLDLLTEYSEENTIPMMQKLVVLWNKKFKLRATRVITALGVIDTALALNACDEFYKKSKYSWNIRDAASKALQSAAKRRGISLTDLYDELVPTFGLTKEGLLLDTGTRVLTVQLKPSLSLSVVDEATGKNYKNLPKARKDEDENLRVAAESQFKLLKKNIKPVVKSLKSRFTESFEVGQSWAPARWKLLFLEHPVMSLVGQGFVWEIRDGKQVNYFRIAEDLNLIDSDDNEVTIEHGTIQLMHPAETEQTICEAWRAHLDDYEMEGFIDQFSADPLSTVKLEKEAQSLTLFNKTYAEYGKFKRLVEKNNYAVGDGDGSWISEYYRYYANSGWRVDIHLEDCRIFMAFDDKVEFGNVHFIHNKKNQKLSAVPKRLLSSVITLIREIQN